MTTRFGGLAMVLGVAGVVGSMPAIARAQRVAPQIPIDRVMSPEELARTGIGQLSAQQRVALEAWLARYTAAVAQVARRHNDADIDPDARVRRLDPDEAAHVSAPDDDSAADETTPPPTVFAAPTPAVRDADRPRAGRAHPRTAPVGDRVLRNIDDGSFVMLADGTMWEINLPDRPTSDTWTAGDYVIVRRDPAPVGDYDYILVNGAAHGSARARFAGWIRTERGPGR